MHPFGPALNRPVLTSELRRGIDRLAAACRQEHSRVVHRRQLGQPAGELKRGLVGEVTERRVRLETPHLRAHRVGDLRAPVANIRVPQARARIQIAPAIAIKDPNILATLHHKLRVANRRHVREGVP